MLICKQGIVVPDRSGFCPFSCNLDPNRDQIEVIGFAINLDKFGDGKVDVFVDSYSILKLLRCNSYSRHYVDSRVKLV